MRFNFIKTEIDGVFVIEPKVFEDSRGYFFESYNEEEFIKNGITNRFVQDNQSKSSYGVIRGLHCQIGQHSQAKLIRVLAGNILDVAVDIRKGSPTFGKHIAIELSAQNQRQLFIPRDFLHGFSVLSQEAILSYKCDNLYCKEAEFGIRYDDPQIAIDWKIPAHEVIVSQKDLLSNSFKDILNER
ncbi:dTDP-4-dehydrorhamnose 3,5-epimerase [Campylobacter lanienae]|uniref:dTDP-4-dehydrorhamnose 3,5-epimerase n=1 Tax=Campylobacter lanienae TaxID=75658 RepID=UPI000BB420B9|nr:dTDP-4-dehydrorhamnose 3,5-epimerase [Campylobacter lanienae]